jgi:hypothetical protein
MPAPAQESTPDVLNLQKLDLERMAQSIEMDFSAGSCLSNSCNPKEEQATAATPK